MAETYTASAPIKSDPGATTFRVAAILFDWAHAYIEITLREWNGSTFTSKEVTASYEGASATTLMTQLNKVNLSTQSLHSRVIDRLKADGKLPAGNTSGAPD